MILLQMILEREPATEFEEIGTVQFVTTFKRNSYELTQPDSVGETDKKVRRKVRRKSWPLSPQVLISVPVRLPK